MICGATLLASCLPIWEARDMQERIDALEAEQEVTQKRLETEKKELETMIEGARADVGELRDVLKEAKSLLQRNNADLGAELQETRKEIQKLRGKIEETQFRVQKMTLELQEFKEDVDMRFADRGVAELPEEADELWEFGKKKFEDGQLRAARQAFGEFLKQHANDDRAARAQFYLGEIHYKEGTWVSGIFDFRKVLKNFPDSELKPRAAYQIGVGFVQLQKCEKAKPFFETVIADYGNSSVAPEAQSKLDAIKRGECR